MFHILTGISSLNIGIIPVCLSLWLPPLLKAVNNISRDHLNIDQHIIIFSVKFILSQISGNLNLCNPSIHFNLHNITLVANVFLHSYRFKTVNYYLAAQFFNLILYFYLCLKYVSTILDIFFLETKTSDIYNLLFGSEVFFPQNFTTVLVLSRNKHKNTSKNKIINKKYIYKGTKFSMLECGECREVRQKLLNAFLKPQWTIIFSCLENLYLSYPRKKWVSTDIAFLFKLICLVFAKNA